MVSYSFNYLVDLLGIQPVFVKSLVGMIIAFFLTYVSIPKIIRVSYKKQLMAVPGERSSHVRKTPNLGGVAIFYSIVVVASIFAYELFSTYIFLLAAIVVLFFIGLMDDILVVAPDKKLYAQVIAAFMIAIGSDIRIDNFFGIFGIEGIPYIISIVFTTFVFVVFINAYNLIDGIDGLAASIGTLCCLAFAISFWRLGRANYPMIVFCFVVIGSLLAFMRFNFHKTYKIIMGDTGSMIVGFIISFLAVKFLSLFSIGFVPYKPTYILPAAPAIVIAILIVPIIDTMSVFTIRLYNNKSPFSPDKNHLHHRFLALGLSHKETTFTIFLINVFIILVAYLLRYLNLHLLLAIVVILGFVFAYAPIFIWDLLNKRKVKR